jgi:hypothetical protein
MGASENSQNKIFVSINFFEGDRKMDTATKPLLLTPNEAAKLLSISARTLWELKSTGKVRCVRIKGTAETMAETVSEFTQQSRD